MDKITKQILDETRAKLKTETDLDKWKELKLLELGQFCKDHKRDYRGIVEVRFKHKKTWFFFCPNCLKMAEKILNLKKIKRR